jgi:hypothetical protein
MKVRIWNSNIDVEIEGDDWEDCVEQFHRDYPDRFGEAVHCEVSD